MPKKRTTIYLEDDIWNKLRHIALDRKMSTSQLLEELIKEKLRNRK